MSDKYFQLSEKYILNENKKMKEYKQREKEHKA